MIPVKQLENYQMEKTYSPSSIRRQRALTVPLLSQINEECDSTEDRTNYSRNIRPNSPGKCKPNALKQKGIIQKANLEYFPKDLEVVKDNLDNRHNSFLHIKLERISSGETLQTMRNRSLTK